MGIILKPLVTEKMTAITTKFNRFGFIVRPDANKLEIKKEVESLYNVTVISVNYSLCWKDKEPFYQSGLTKRQSKCLQESNCYIESRRHYRFL
jgi:large subunit ribosomal protein L23